MNDTQNTPLEVSEEIAFGLGADVTKNQMELSLAIDQRKIFINDSITDESIFRYMFYLHKIVEIDVLSGVEEKLPIEIYVNTIGGDAYECFSFISYLEFLKDMGYHIITINIGKAFSAGFLISLVGNERKSFRYARYMFHDVSGDTYGSCGTMLADIKEIKYLSKMVKDFVLKYTKIPAKTIEAIYRKKEDKYFNAEEMLKFGAIDEII